MIPLALSKWALEHRRGLMLGGAALALSLAVAASAAIVLNTAWHRGYSAAQADEAKRQRAAEKRVQPISDQLAKEDVQAAYVYSSITAGLAPILARPLYSAQCFDLDGVRWVNAALRGPGQSETALPRPHAP